MAETSCPESRALVEFVAGGGEAEFREAVRAHLAQCDRCRQMLKQAGEATVAPGHLLADTVNDSVLTPGSDLPRDVAAAELAELSTRLYTSPEELSSRFDLALLEPSEQPGSLGRLGKCEVLALIGFGGMGVVFRAKDQHLLRNVAIKVMSRDLATSDTARRRFTREARAAAAINHPNVVTIHSVEEHNGTPFLVMELLDGESLRDRLRHQPKLELLDVLNIAAQVAAGLAAAHAHGVIHRDIKPGNIMLLDKLQRVKITDFGLARVALDNVELTSGEMGIGTPTYMSPEQVKGGKIDARSDLFALGCVMYAMLRGHSPFQGSTALEIARNVVDGQPSPPVTDEHVPAFLTDIIERLLEKSPDSRYQSAAEVADLLRRHLAMINQTPTSRLSELLRPRAKRRSLAVWLPVLTAAALVMLGAAATWAWRIREPARPQPVQPMQALIPGALPGVLSEEPAPEPVQPQVYTVSQGDDADFSSVAAALAKAQPRDTIRILDSAEYRESIVLNDAQRHAGITIEGNWESPPTFFNPDSGSAPLQIRNVPEVTIRGLRFRQTDERQHAVIISGGASGALLENLKIEGVSTSYALVYFASARGTPEKPLVIRRSSIAGKFLGLMIQQAGEGAPVTHVHVLESRLATLGTQAQVNVAAEGVRFVGNVFEGGIGLSLGLPEPASSRDLMLASNTFFRCDTWLSLRDTSPEIEGAIVNNLLLEQGRNLIKIEGRHSLESFAKSASWKFAGNYCEIEPPVSPLLRGFARYQERIAVESREASDPGYLRPAMPLEAVAAPVEDLPERVGAVGR